MDFQRNNQIKHDKASLEARYKQQEALLPVELQNEYNKQNLETQHKHNLEIFEKQADLTREMQRKQSELTKRLAIIAAVATIIAAIVGSLLTYYINSKTDNKIKQNTSQETTQTYQPQNELKKYQPPQTKTKQSGQGGSSSKNAK